MRQIAHHCFDAPAMPVELRVQLILAEAAITEGETGERAAKEPAFAPHLRAELPLPCSGCLVELLRRSVMQGLLGHRIGACLLRALHEYVECGRKSS